MDKHEDNWQVWEISDKSVSHYFGTSKETCILIVWENETCQQWWNFKACVDCHISNRSVQKLEMKTIILCLIFLMGLAKSATI